MDKKFSKLRFDEFKMTATAMAVGGAMALQPVTALAVPVTATGTGAFTINAGNAVWHLNNNITFSTTSSNWGFSEGSLNGTRSDAFDGSLGWLVSTGVPNASNGYRSPGGTIDISPAFPTNPLVGTTATGTAQVMAGLNVSGQIYFSPVRAVARSILVMQNPTGAPITVNVGNMSNLGSDNNTFLQLTSSGDQTFDPTDNWVVSSQGQPLIPADPVLTYAYQGVGGAVRGIPNPNLANASDRFREFYTVTIPAGQTRRLMVFVQMSTTVAQAEADAALFTSSATLAGTDYLSGLSAAELSTIVNWSFVAAAATIGDPIPTMGNWALVGLAWLLGLFGLGSLRGRRRKASTRAA
jgi:hypothetical protein